MDSKKTNLTRHLIPREHGAWAMWILPFIIGCAAAGGVAAGTVLIFGTCLFAFAARTALGAAIRLRRRNTSVALKCLTIGLVELMLALGLAGPVLISGNHWLPVLGFAAAVLFLADLWWINNRSEHSIFAELLGVAGFALSAPVAYLVSSGVWHVEAVILWGVSFAYFAGSIFFVKLRLVRMTPGRKNGQAESFYARLTLAYIFGLSILTLLFSVLTWIQAWLFLAFLPWILHMLWEGFYVQPDKNLNRTGWALVAHSVYFTTFVSLLFALN